MYYTSADCTHSKEITKFIFSFNLCCVQSWFLVHRNIFSWEKKKSWTQRIQVNRALTDTHTHVVTSRPRLMSHPLVFRSGFIGPLTASHITLLSWARSGHVLSIAFTPGSHIYTTHCFFRPERGQDKRAADPEAQHGQVYVCVSVIFVPLSKSH